MARVGFKKTYPAGAFDAAAMQTLFGHIKTYVTNAGFNILLDTANGIDFIRAGLSAGTAHDDAPHWAFSMQDGGSVSIFAHPVYGANYLDAHAYANASLILSPDLVTPPSPKITILFAADGEAGWWWMHGTEEDQTSSTGVKMRFTAAGVTSRRYPSDTHQGLCARYGIWKAWGAWYPPYAKNEYGVINPSPWTGTWSPFGEGWSFNGRRHVGSPLPRMAVPQFPNRDTGISACILGEFNEILILTDGYAQEEVVMPGWIAMTGSEKDQPYAVPAPERFDVL
ncbi:hypothetical protein [Thiofaba sp. EF100]|uniref:hypothetical protein n=1 Tax=Thiofaba sp. EF100 TaxID=3121274 RepID=UPI003221A4A4